LLRQARNDKANSQFVIARSEAARQSSAMQRTFQPAVYIVASKRNGTIYTGVTSNLPQRIGQHREGAIDGFSKRYGCKMLVWYEVHATMEYAIAREKQIKAGNRKRKLALIEQLNPQWCDLFARICA
jgi:putative endonuclease